MNSSQNLKGIVIAESIASWNNLIAASIVVFLTIYLIILKLVQLGFVLNISLVAFLYLYSTREQVVRIFLLPPITRSRGVRGAREERRVERDILEVVKRERAEALYISRSSREVSLLLLRTEN
ncbi:hypothetical protein BGZ57DRAFT_852935 [Hyaloscypha finlandica]|nr:hypothetical protein BGZ57DRAFT_852935 [Hyaloscypha finlandica]